MISPLEMNGVISRTQDIASLRHNEDNKTFVDHGNVMNQIETKRDEASYTVKESAGSNQMDSEHDAKEKGKNTFFDIRKKDKKKDTPKDGVVKVKGPSTGFDFKI